MVVVVVQLSQVFLLTYQWTQTSGPSVTLNDPTAVNPTFNAPDVLLQRDLVFELVVTNEQGIQSEPDSVTITVVSDFEGSVGSGNNVNIQVQENSGNSVVGQHGFGRYFLLTHPSSKDNQRNRIVR